MNVRQQIFTHTIFHVIGLLLISLTLVYNFFMVCYFRCILFRNFIMLFANWFEKLIFTNKVSSVIHLFFI